MSNLVKHLTGDMHYLLSDISMEAKGLLTFLLYVGDDACITIEGLKTVCHCYQQRITRMINELKEAGYLKTQRQYGEKGHFKIIYEVWDKI